MNSTVKWTLAFGAGSALLSAGVLLRIHKADGALDVHPDPGFNVQEASVVSAPPPEVQTPRAQARQHYLSGVVFAQKNDFEKAVEEFKLAKELDPADADIDAALRRYGPLAPAAPAAAPAPSAAKARKKGRR